MDVDGAALGTSLAFFMEYRFPAGKKGYNLTIDGSGLSTYGTMNQSISSLYGFPLRNPQQCINLHSAGGTKTTQTSNDAPYAKCSAFKLTPTTSDAMSGLYSLRIWVIY